MPVLAVLALVACRDASGPDSTVAASVEVVPGPGSLEGGESLRFFATVRDLAGRVIPSAPVTWSVTPAGALTIDATGLATAGLVSATVPANVVATHGVLSDTAVISVVPRRFPTDRQPIMFVHGLGGSSADWGAVITLFRSDGWTAREVFAATYSSLASNASIAAAIQAHVDSVRAATGWDTIDIVSYSMGSLSSRYFLRELGGAAVTEAWVSVAGPNHGTSTAFQCALTPCVEMQPGSAFLAGLNAADETPGDVRYATWWSACDGLVEPPESTILDGAQNTQTACLTHANMLTDEIYQQVKAFIASGPPG